jgi:hypothetical protein
MPSSDSLRRLANLTKKVRDDLRKGGMGVNFRYLFRSTAILARVVEILADHVATEAEERELLEAALEEATSAEAASAEAMPEDGPQEDALQEDALQEDAATEDGPPARDATYGRTRAEETA